MNAFHELFSGEGMVRTGLGRAWQCLFANDSDPRKAAAYRANWGDGEMAVDDVRDISLGDLPGRANLGLGSFRCQDLSLAGSGAGLRGERSGAFRPFAPASGARGKRPSAGRSHARERDWNAHLARGKEFPGHLWRAGWSGIPLRRVGDGCGAVRSATVCRRCLPRSGDRRRGGRTAFALARVREQECPRGSAEQTRAFVGMVEHAETAGARAEVGVSDRRIARRGGAGCPRRNWSASVDDEPGEFGEGRCREGRRSPRGRRSLLAHPKSLRKKGPQSRGALRWRRWLSAHARRRVVPAIRAARPRREDSVTIDIRPGNRSLMGLPESYVLPASRKDANHLTVDGVAVPVVQYIARHVIEPILNRSWNGLGTNPAASWRCQRNWNCRRALESVAANDGIS